ncbi:hypothetical protein HNQ62_002657 [Sulfurisphaera ohwakuensis]|uniref:Uncharacterized protein n=2 Tax=Sulfurisphaera ohwakuensis TaxID=69656 RepID=A0A7J9RV75_SULOH|nr:hypothetical protein [Sulfurisphaera ohwakuensis]
MALAIFNMILEGEVNVKNFQKFFSNILAAAEILSQAPTEEPLKSLYEKYAEEVKGLEELKSKDDIFYFSYLAHRLFDDYLNNGKLKSLLEEVDKLKIDKTQLSKKEEKEVKDDKKLESPVYWIFKTHDLLGLLRKFNSVRDKEFESEYLGVKVYVTIKPNEEEIDLYDPLIFFTKNKPRLGIKFGEIAVDPYEIKVLQIYESREYFILSMMEKICGKLTLKTKIVPEITNVFTFKHTAFLTRALRYTHWALRTSKLTLSEVVNHLPFLLGSINKPKQFVNEVLKDCNRMQTEGIDWDYIKKEIENLGWYNIKLPNKPSRKEDRSLNRLKDFYDLSEKLGNPIMLIAYLLTSIIFVYEVNGYDYKQLFEI